MENPPKVNRTEPYRAVPCSGKAPLEEKGWTPVLELSLVLNPLTAWLLLMGLSVVLKVLRLLCGGPYLFLATTYPPFQLQAPAWSVRPTAVKTSGYCICISMIISSPVFHRKLEVLQVKKPPSDPCIFSFVLRHPFELNKIKSEDKFPAQQVIFQFLNSPFDSKAFFFYFCIVFLMRK